jgi:hypothetical protein
VLVTSSVTCSSHLVYIRGKLQFYFILRVLVRGSLVFVSFRHPTTASSFFTYSYALLYSPKRPHRLWNPCEPNATRGWSRPRTEVYSPESRVRGAMSPFLRTFLCHRNNFWLFSELNCRLPAFLAQNYRCVDDRGSILSHPPGVQF